jgi:hypothetical protein
MCSGVVFRSRASSAATRSVVVGSLRWPAPPGASHGESVSTRKLPSGSASAAARGPTADEKVIGSANETRNPAAASV